MTQKKTLLQFHCSQCGECCRHIDKVPQLSAFDTGDGVCVHLCGNKCDIYKTRPEICRVDVMYEKHFSSQFSRAEFYALNERVCRELQVKKISEADSYDKVIFKTKDEQNVETSI